MTEIFYETGFGDICTVAQKAIDFARLKIIRAETVRVKFIFNDLEVIAYSNSNPYDIAEKYFLMNQLRRAKLGHRD